MPIVSQKRQITLPIEQCREAGILPGDEYESFVDQYGHITIIKKKLGAANGLLKSMEIEQDDEISDEDSRDLFLESDRGSEHS